MRCDDIEHVPGVQVGERVARGTRTPVPTVVTLYLHTYPGDVDKVQCALPHLRPEQIDAALGRHQRAHRAYEELVSAR